jgi:hypothetical protein
MINVMQYLSVYVRLSVAANRLEIAERSNVRRLMDEFNEALSEYDRIPKEVKEIYVKDVDEFLSFARRKKSEFEAILDGCE